MPAPETLAAILIALGALLTGLRLLQMRRGQIQRLIEGGAIFMTMENAMQEWLARQQPAS